MNHDKICGSSQENQTHLNYPLVTNEPVQVVLALQKGGFTVSCHVSALRSSPSSVSVYNDYLDIIRVVKGEDVLH